MKTCEMRREVRKPVSRFHGHLHQLVGVQAAFHHGQGIAGAAHGHAQLGGLGLGFGVEDGIRRDVQAQSGGQRLHGGFVADQRRLDEALDGGLDGSPQSHVRKGPDHRRGDGRKLFAALDELVKDVVVGGMADQRVYGYGFSQRARSLILLLLAGAVDGWLAYASIVGQWGRSACAKGHKPGHCLIWRDICRG